MAPARSTDTPLFGGRGGDVLGSEGEIECPGEAGWRRNRGGFGDCLLESDGQSEAEAERVVTAVAGESTDDG